MNPDTTSFTFQFDRPLTLAALSTALEEVDSRVPMRELVVTSLHWAPSYAPAMVMPAFNPAPLPEAPSTVGGTLTITIDTAQS